MIRIVISYGLKPILLKQEIDHDQFFEDTWEDKEDERLPYLENDVLSTAFSYAKYTKGMEKLTSFGLKNSITLPSLAIKYFNSLSVESDQPIYTYDDEYMCYLYDKTSKEVDVQL